MFYYLQHILGLMTLAQWAKLFGLFSILIVVAGMSYFFSDGKNMTYMRASPIYRVGIVASISLILWSTLLIRTPGTEHQANFIPLWSWHKGFLQGNEEIRLQIYFNILLFLPFGFFSQLSKARPLGRTILRGFLLSLFIEMCQYIFRLGLFEWDDMIHNTLGCVLGCLCAGGVRRIWSKMR